MGIDVPRPRLSWWLDDDRPAEIQTAYQIQAASSEARLAAGDPDLWDSGYVSSRQTCNLEYQGRPLGSGQGVWWRVRTYDSDGMPSPWSQPGRFETGLLKPEEWQGQWIGARLAGSPATSVPAVLLARDFQLHQQPSEARLYLTALGACVAEINGQPVAEQPLTPAWHDYRKRVAYQALDVTVELQTGNNRIGVLLGDGFFCGALGKGLRQQYGDRPWLYAQLVLRFPGGESRVIVSDGSWQWRPSWVLQSDPFRGESIDARQWLRDWSVAGIYEDWYPVTVNQKASPKLCAEWAAPVQISGERSPTAPAVRRVDDCGRVRLLYDFGVNLLGRLRLGLQVTRGAAIRIRYAEAVAHDGELVDTAGPPDEDHYAASGDESGEVFQSVFGLHAFRYVEVSGYLGREAVTDIAALPVTTAAPPAGQFDSDHLLLNELHQNVQRTLHHTLLAQPLAGFDARQRLGLTADGRAQMGVAACLLEAAPAYRSWLRDLVDAQRDDGGLPAVVPPLPTDTARRAEDGSPGGDVALLVCAWSLYRRYGDRRSLELAYPSIQRILASLRERAPALILDNATDLEASVVDTAWYCYALTLAARIAGVLGRLADLEAYEALRLRVRDAFRQHFVTPQGLIVGDSQQGYLLGLYLGLLSGAERPRALQRLEDQLRQGGYHAGVDFREGGLLLEVLTLAGRADLAFEILLQTSAPSWLHPLLEGATSSWDEVTGARSRPAAGSVVEWLYSGLAGIELDPDLTPDQNAYRAVRIRPYPPLGIGFAAGPPLRRVAAAVDTINGRFESAWEIDEAAFVLRVRIPCNCSASVILPDGSEHHVVAGRHEFRLSIETPDEVGDGIPLLRKISEAS